MKRTRRRNRHRQPLQPVYVHIGEAKAITTQTGYPITAAFQPSSDVARLFPLRDDPWRIGVVGLLEGEVEVRLQDLEGIVSFQQVVVVGTGDDEDEEEEPGPSRLPTGNVIRKQTPMTRLSRQQKTGKEDDID